MADTFGHLPGGREGSSPLPSTIVACSSDGPPETTTEPGATSVAPYVVSGGPFLAGSSSPRRYAGLPRPASLLWSGLCQTLEGGGDAFATFTARGPPLADRRWQMSLDALSANVA